MRDSRLKILRFDLESAPGAGMGKRKAVDIQLNTNGLVLGDPGGARTLDPLIKSQLLYQLSYGVIRSKRVSRFLRCKFTQIFCLSKIFRDFFAPPGHFS